MLELWRLRIEMSVKPDDFQGDTLGFINVVTWADSVDVARSKVAHYLKSFEWSLLEVEDAHIVDSDATYGEELSDMIDRARGNPNAIILGTFHTYKVN